ncbi:lytic transglycosylase [Halorhodospira halophila]|nr:lytic transglycosylase [Halorhodospira halophila]
MDVKRTAAGALTALSVTACTSFDSRTFVHDLHGPEADGRDIPAWVRDLETETLEAGLGRPFELTPDYDYQPGHYTRTVPDYPLQVWDRLRTSFRIDCYENERVERELQLFAGRDAYFEAVGRRAEPYLHYILDELEERDLPAELVALAIVESGFRPFAYSHGRAAGIWQFIPSTGRFFGLEMNYWYDGRRDLVASTDAALDYLERLNEAFDGDWLLAMAAYNAGQGNVRAAIQRARAEGKDPNYWNLQLPAETMRYVPRILAIRDILQDPEAHDVALPNIPNKPRIRVVEADRQIDLALAAELADISIDRLYILNPGLNRWATAPEGPHRLVLPKENADRFERELAAMDPEDFVEWRRHRIESGETLTHVANQYNVTVELLRDINGLRGDTVRAGDHLYVPVSSRPPSEYSLSAANRLEALQNRERQGERREHTVQAGETLWDIARTYNVGVKELARWNGMAPGDTLRPSQELVVWVEGDVMQAAGGPGDSSTQSVTYTVRQGDSLARIAQRFNVNVGDIKRWNGISEGSYLHPGDQLKLEVDVTQQSSSL